MIKFAKQEKVAAWRLWERQLSAGELNGLNRIVYDSYAAPGCPPVLKEQDVADIWNCKPAAYDRREWIMPLYKHQGEPKNLVGLVRIIIGKWLEQVEPISEFGAPEDLQCWTEE